MSVVSSRTQERVAVLTIDHPPVNAISAAVREALGSALERAAADDGVDAIVIECAGRTFSAGSDITEFGTEKAKAPPLLSELQRRIERSPKPVIAAIHGTALGGGFELALACAARVATPEARVGLPEVTLGLLPGGGGTQRLTRLIGPEAAIEIITSGKHVPSARALELGAVDALADDATEGAVAFATAAVAERRTSIPAIDREDRTAAATPAMFEAARAQAAKKQRGRDAPRAIIDCIEAACTRPAAEGLAFEKAAFQQLYAGDQRKALIHIFHAEREARRVPGIPADGPVTPIERVGIVGAGTMGGGIAMVFADAGFDVTLLDVNGAALAGGRERIEKTYAISVSRGSRSEAAARESLARIAGTTRYEDLGVVDLVVEAALEKLELKSEIFAMLDRVVPAHAILGSNTSSLDIDAIAAATGRPEKVIGAHFFAPANVMKLLENVRGAKTSPETIATMMGLGKRIGKMVALAGNCDGFIGNRMLQYYSASAEFLMEQGATPEQIDRVAVAFGMPMGSPSMRDLTGLDTGLLVRKAREKSLPPGERFSPILQRLVEAGRVGQKVGKGFYRYEGREKFPDPEVAAIIADVARELGVRQRTLSDEEVRDRMFMPLVNEGAKELEDGTAMRAGDIDVVWTYGYNFPAHKGGPMFWGAQIGLDKVVAMAERLGEENGPRWRPGPLITRLARTGEGWGTAASAAG